MSDAEPKSFVRPAKIFFLAALMVLVYLVAVIVLVPAGWLWHQASAYVPLPHQVRVQQVSGRIWDGAAGIIVSGFPVRLGWQLGWPSLTSLSLPVEISLASSQSSLDGNVTIGWPSNVQVDARGRLAVAEFEGLIRQSGGAMIEGEVTIDQIHLALADNKITLAEGVGRWAGGQVSWPMGNQVGQAQFPPMQANLDTTQGGVALIITEQGGDGPAADASILWNGMMEVRVYKRMVDLAGQPWPDSASPGDIVFRVRQPLLPGAR
jgi:general secretion pathway protein N